MNRIRTDVNNAQEKLEHDRMVDGSSVSTGTPARCTDVGGKNEFFHGVY